MSQPFSEVHNGTICVHTDGEGKGSTFTLELSVAVFAEKEDGTRGTAPELDPKVRLGLRVLIIDYDSDTRGCWMLSCS